MKETKSKNDTKLLPRNENKLENEWLETNGLGSYSSSTSLFCNTRKYHGLLVSSSNKLTERTVLLSKFDEHLFYGEKQINLSTHYYQPGVYIPFETDLETAFECKLNPCWYRKSEDIYLKQELLMLEQEDTVLMNYDFIKLANKEAVFELKPLVAFRNFHHLIRESFDHDYSIERINSGIKIANSKYELFIYFNCNFEIESNAFWYRNFLYQAEQQRGYDAVEDLYCPCSIKINLNDSQEFKIAISTKYYDDSSWIEDSWKDEIKARKKKHTGLTRLLKSDSSLFINRLNKAREDFIVKLDDDQYSVIAGYHWFNSWGRDTFISLPGLFMQTKDKDIFINILKNYLSLEKDGLLPNMTGASVEDSAYNCVDASLWMFWALTNFVENFQDDLVWLEDLYASLKNIYDSYFFNQAPGVTRTDNNLLSTGHPGDTMSWMDAMVDGQAASPRYGYVIEINALWLNATDFMNSLAEFFDDTEMFNRTKAMLDSLPQEIFETFWDEDLGFFADYVADGVRNSKLRPNQLFLLALECLDLPYEEAQSAIRKVSEELLTPRGLRTLSFNDPDYIPYYEGDGKQRDRAYHNGTVWPWLLGAYCDAFVNYADNKTQAKKSIKNILLDFNKHFEEAGINNVSEIFDATEPFMPRGCIAQAWSVAELRRAFLKYCK